MRRVTLQQEIRAAANLKQAKWECRGGWKYSKSNKSKAELRGGRSTETIQDTKPSDSNGIHTDPPLETSANALLPHQGPLFLRELEQVAKSKAKKLIAINCRGDRSPSGKDVVRDPMLETLVSTAKDLSIEIRSLQTQIQGLQGHHLLVPCSSVACTSYGTSCLEDGCDEGWVELME